MTLAAKVLMVYPAHFDVNPETAADNFFVREVFSDSDKIKTAAAKEFETLKQKLERAGIDVVVFNPVYSSPAPDAVFPNNWFSTHADGTLVLYPMLSPSRRIERHPEIISFLTSHSKNILDLTASEKENRFLEGTGSIVIDHKNKMAYASESMRTNAGLFYEWCKMMNHKPVLFHATDENNNPVYHTNVILTIADDFAILCSASIRHKQERENVKSELAETGHELLEISFAQAGSFAGNALALSNNKRQQVLVISSAGWNALNEEQQNFLQQRSAQIITSPLKTIETCGGGSARCMLAELF